MRFLTTWSQTYRNSMRSHSRRSGSWSMNAISWGLTKSSYKGARKNQSRILRSFRGSRRRLMGWWPTILKGRWSCRRRERGWIRLRARLKVWRPSWGSMEISIVLTGGRLKKSSREWRLLIFRKWWRRWTNQSITKRRWTNLLRMNTWRSSCR